METGQVEVSLEGPGEGVLYPMVLYYNFLNSCRRTVRALHIVTWFYMIPGLCLPHLMSKIYVAATTTGNNSTTDGDHN